MREDTGLAAPRLLFRHAHARSSLLYSSAQGATGTTIHLGHATRSVALALVDATDAAGEARISAATIARVLGMHPRNVQQHMQALRVAGLLDSGHPGRALYTWSRNGLAAAFGPETEIERRIAAKSSAVSPDHENSGDGSGVDARVWGWVVNAYRWARASVYGPRHVHLARPDSQVGPVSLAARAELSALASRLAFALKPMDPANVGVDLVMRAAFRRWMERHPGLTEWQHPLRYAAEDVEALERYAFEAYGREEERTPPAPRVDDATPPRETMSGAELAAAAGQLVRQLAGGMR